MPPSLRSPQPVSSEERAPLLAPLPINDSVNGDDGNRSLAPRRWFTILLLFFIIFTVDIGVMIMNPALNSMIERNLCARFYDSIVPHDERCKQPDVQGSLARLRGWMMAFDTIPGFVTIIPYGMMSDKIGRKPVLLLSWLGLILSTLWTLAVLFFPTLFPPAAILFEAAFTFIGGGSLVGVATVFSSISDIVPAESRTSTFSQLAATAMVAQFVGSPLAGLLMSKSDKLAILFSTGILLVSFAAIFILPETRWTITDNPTNENSGVEAHPDHRPKGLGAILRYHTKSVWDFARGNPRTMLLVLPAAFFVLGRFVQEVLLQYATKRYHWDWSQAAYHLGLMSFTNLLIYIFILPASSWLLVHKLHISALSKDLWLARLSGSLSALGAVMVALSTDGFAFSIALMVFSSGSAFTVLLRSMINTLVDSQHVGTVNSLIGWIESIGMIVSGPLFAEAFRIGFNKEGAWVGLPFFLAAIFLAISTSIVWVYKIPGDPTGDHSTVQNE